MLELEQILLICEILSLPAATHKSYIESLGANLFKAFGQPGLDRIILFLDRVEELEEISYSYAGDANSTLIKAETLEWSEGGRQQMAGAKRGQYAMRLAVLLGDPSLANNSSGQYAGYTPLRRG